MNYHKRRFQLAASAAIAAALVGCGITKVDDLRHSPNYSPSPGANASDGLALNAGTLALRGVNLAGAEFGANQFPGTYGTTYIYPTHGEVDYFVGKGMNVFRIPFMWERVQPQGSQELNATEMARLDDIVNYVVSKGATALIDPHNYARYYGQVIGSGNISNATFADLWRRLALRYANNNKIIFGLMNEPHDLPTEQWVGAAQAAINAIRAAKANNLIFVPGNSWTGASSWAANFYGTPNAVAMLSIKDPMNNYAFEVHQYLDADFSGTNANCVNGTIGSAKLAGFTDWLHKNGKRGFLGEFAGGNNGTCLAAIDDTLKHMEANSDVYLGWTWWAAGPWWGNYMFSIEPSASFNSGLMGTLSRHLSGTPSATPSPMPASAPLPPASSPVPTPAPAPNSGSSALSGSLAISSEWNNGYCAVVTIRNSGTATVNSWTAQVEMKSGTLTESWSAGRSNVGSRYSFTPVNYNSTVAPGATVNFGFCVKEGADFNKAWVVSVK